MAEQIGDRIEQAGVPAGLTGQGHRVLAIIEEQRPLVRPDTERPVDREIELDCVLQVSEPRAVEDVLEVRRAIVETSIWKTPSDVKKAHPKASILKGGRVVFNIKANDYRLVALVQYQARIVMIRFFGSHQDYDRIDAETV